MKMNKKVVLATLAVSLLGVKPVFAIDLNINNQLVQVSQEPVIQNGTTLVPLRVISEKLGASVDWKAETQQVTVVKGEDKIELTINSKKAKVNGQVIDMPQAPQTINGTTMLPVRFVAENLKCEVKYDKASQTVYVTSDGVVAEIPDTSNWKTTKISNPKVVDGKVYLTKAQMEKAFDVVVDAKNPLQITRQDVHMWLIKESQDGKHYNRINWAYVPHDKGEYVLTEGSTLYYPVEYLAPYLNSSVSYDKNTKELTVTYKGIKIHETIPEDQKLNDVKGYVYLPDGSPAVDFEVRWYQVAWDKGEPIVTHTDKNGYYEFKGVDTSKYPRFDVGVYGENHKDTKYAKFHGIPGAVLTNKNQTQISNFDKAATYSTLKQMPDIYLVDNSIWD